MAADKIIVTVSGVDKVGIVAKVTTTFADYGVNIEDIKQTLMQGHFVCLCYAILKTLNTRSKKSKMLY